MQLGRTPVTKSKVLIDSPLKIPAVSGMRKHRVAGLYED